MEIGSITSSYLNKVIASYSSNTEEGKEESTAISESLYDSYEKSSTEKVEETSYYGDYESMAEKILGKDLETAIHNTKRIIYGLSNALINPDSTDTVTNYYDSTSIIDQVSDNSLEKLIGSVSSEEKVEDVTEAKGGTGSGGASGDDEGETETKIVTRNGVRYLEITTTYSDGRTSVETRSLDGYTGDEAVTNDLMSML